MPITTSLKIDYAIFTAMSEEMAYFKTYFQNFPTEQLQIKNFIFNSYSYKNKKIILVETGFGTTFAASMLTLIHHYCAPSHVFLSGTAGAIHPELRLCDVVIAAEAFEAEVQEIFNMVKNTPFETCLKHPAKGEYFPSIYSADRELLAIAQNISHTKVRIGTVVSSNAFPAPLTLFEKIKSLNPYCIDMETSAFYQVAWLLGIRVLSVRGISNVLNHNGSDDHIHLSDLHGSAKAAASALLAVIDAI